MKKREWFVIIFPLLAAWLLDRITKSWAHELTSIVTYGPFTFHLNFNHGALLGLFSSLPAVLRVVSLSTTGAFLLCTYALVQYLLPISSLSLRFGLSLLVGGIIGNVTDRIIWGYVVDFIVLGNPPWFRVAFNVADAIQWIGYAMIFVIILREGERIWPEKNARKKYWVNRSFQLKYCFILMAVGISLTLISLVFSYTYLRVTIQELMGANPLLRDKFLVPFIITYSVIALAYCALLFAVGKVISHRIAGPLYAFERFLHNTLRGGPPAPLKLRNGDDFKYLENLANEIGQQIQALKMERSNNVIEFSDKTSEVKKTDDSENTDTSEKED